MLRGVACHRVWHAKGCGEVRGRSGACLRVVQREHPQRPLLRGVALEPPP